MEEKIRKIINQKIRPAIRSHGGDVRLLRFTDGNAEVELTGACVGCPGADNDTREYMEMTLQKELPEIHSVSIHHPIDPEAYNLAMKILKHQL